MYRRLKNLLGVSLIILAIVLSQLPMGAVQADTSSQNGTEVSEESVDNREKTESDENVDKEENAESDENVDNGENAEPDENVDNGEKTESDENVDNGENTEAEGNAGINLANNTGTGDSTTTASNVTYDVTFDYGFVGLKPTITNTTVGSGNPIQIAEDKWKITDDTGVEQVLSKQQYYTIGGFTYQFLGWCIDSACSTAWDMAKGVPGDLDLYAAWQCIDKEKFKITYSASEADTDELQQVEIPAGTRLKAPANSPTRTGYTFIKWIERVNDTDVDINWNEIPTSNKVYYARWEDRRYVVTFEANGGTFSGANQGLGTVTTKVLRGEAIPEADFPTIDQTSFTGFTVDSENWYTDQEGLNLFDKSTTISAPKTLYKKWYQITDQGFMISADGRVLYSYSGTGADVTIPSTVTIIASNAFADMSEVESITLPAGLADVKADAFSGANDISREIAIYSTVDGNLNSMEEGKELAARYDCFTYIGSVGTGGTGGGSGSSTPSLSTSNITCNLSDINLGIYDNEDFTYPKVFLPTDLNPGNYQMTFTELNTPTTIKDLLQKKGYKLDDKYVYYMDITLKNLDATNDAKVSWANTMSVTMPLPYYWVGQDTSKIFVFTVSEDGTELEQVTRSFKGNNIFTFYPKHFSEYALVFDGELITPDAGNDSTTGGGSSGGLSSGGSSSGGSSSGGSSSGGSSSGGSSSGGSSSGGSSSGGSSSGGSSSSGGNNVVTATPTVTTPGVTTPNIPLVTPAPAPGTQPTITTPAGTTGGSAGGTTAHVKDSTPKTGDPMEYRSILVCSFFSIGVLLLLIGNKKRTSSSSRYLRV